MEGLTVGRIVHVTQLQHDYSSGERVTTRICRAGIVTEVREQDLGIIGVSVFQPGGGVDPQVCEPGDRFGGWHWPERA